MGLSPAGATPPASFPRGQLHILDPKTSKVGDTYSKNFGSQEPQWVWARVAGPFLLPSLPGRPTWAQSHLGWGLAYHLKILGDFRGESSPGKGCAGGFSPLRPQ